MRAVTCSVSAILLADATLAAQDQSSRAFEKANQHAMMRGRRFGALFWHNGYMYPLIRSVLTCFLALASVVTTNVDAQERKTLPVGDQAAPQRIAPPTGVTCDRNQLTSYNGVVSDYKRSPGSISITISTDWGTNESIAIQPENGEFEPYFLLFNRPFSKEDWQLIESGPGELLPNVRANAWICLDDITPPLIDWQPGYSKPGRSRVQP